MKIGRRLKGVCAVVAGLALTLGGAVSATAAPEDVARYTLPEVEYGSFGVTISEDDRATLAAHGVALHVSQTPDGKVRLEQEVVDPELFAAAYPEQWVAPHEVEEPGSWEGEYGASVRVLTPMNHDEDKFQSEYAVGDLVGGEYSAGSAGIPVVGEFHDYVEVPVHAHTSYREGGVARYGTTIPISTWAADDYQQQMSDALISARSQKGITSHFEGTLSDATDGTTAITVQLFAVKGMDNQDAYDVEYAQNSLMALTDGITIHIDTSDTKWMDVPMVASDEWSYGMPPEGYFSPSDEASVHLPVERIEGNLRERLLFFSLGDLLDGTGRPAVENAALFQDLPEAPVEAIGEVTVGFVHNWDRNPGTVGVVFFGDGLGGSSYLPTEFIEEDGVYRLTLPVTTQDAFLDDRVVTLDNGSTVEVSGEFDGDGNFVVTMIPEPGVTFAPAESLPDFDLGTVIQVDAPASYLMHLQVFSDEYRLPVAADDYEKTEQDVPVDIWIHENDAVGTGGIEKTTAITQPKNGTIEELVLSFTDEDGVTHEDFVGYTYTPNAGFSGNDQFRYQYEDAEGYTAEATVFIEVTAVEAPPTTPPPTEPPVDPPADPPAPPVEPPTTPPAPPVEPPTSPPDTPDIPGRPDTGVVAPLATSADVEGSAAAEVSAAPDSTDVRSIVSGIAMGVGALLLAAGAVLLFVARSRNGFHRA